MRTSACIKRLCSTYLIKKRLPKDTITEFGYSPIYYQDVSAQVTVNKNQSGLHVIVEKPQFPSMISLGILLNVGSRDENQITSGSLLAMKYFMTNDFHTKFPADFNITFDQEFFYIKVNTLPEDLEAILKLLSEYVQNPLYLLDVRRNLKLGKYTESLEELKMNKDEFNNYILSSAFSGKTLGMPTNGLKSTDKISDFDIISFYEENMTPDRVYVSAGGISNEKAFLELVEKYFNKFPKKSGSELKKREKSVYTGKVKVFESDSPIEAGLALKTSEWTNLKDLGIDFIAFSIIGTSSSFSTGGPGKGMHSRASQQIMSRYYYVESVSCINLKFTDNGIFGLQLQGLQAEDCKNLLNIAYEHLSKLTDPISTEEIERSKNILLSNIFQNMERLPDRLEEISRNISIYGKLMYPEYENIIRSISSKDINNAFAQRLSDTKNFPLSIAAKGKNVAKYLKV